MDQGQMIFLVGSAVIVAYHMLKGWQLGIVRQILRLLALVAAYVVGYLGGKPIAPLLRPLGYPDLVLQLIAGTALGLITYLVISLIAKILFKKTSDQEFWFGKLIYGVTVALIGAGFGLFIVTAVALAIRFTGNLVEGAMPKPADQRATASARPKGKGAALHPTPSRLSPLLTGVVQIKKSLEGGMAGNALQWVDPIPKGTYEAAREVGTLVSKPDALGRLINSPEAKALAQQPEIIALRDDPEIGKAISSGRYLALLRNERVIKTMNNPKIIELMKRFDFRAALDHSNGKSEVKPKH